MRVYQLPNLLHPSITSPSITMDTSNPKIDVDGEHSPVNLITNFTPNSCFAVVKETLPEGKFVFGVNLGEPLFQHAILLMGYSEWV